MPEQNIPPCPTHGAPPRALHTHNFEGIILAASEIIDTVSGVGTISYSRCPYGYPNNFEGVVRVLEDLNTSISGIQAGGGGGGGSASGVVGGSGIYVTISGDSFVINSAALPVYPGSGITPEASGTGLNTGTVFHIVNRGLGSITTGYDGTVNVFNGTGGGGGSSVVISGSPGSNYAPGSLWFDTNEGRLFVYASGNGVEYPDWYQTNAEGIALMSDTPPSGTGVESPPRDGSIWWNTLMGTLFVYDMTTSGWYEVAANRSVAFGAAAPNPIVAGQGWYDSGSDTLRIWDGNSWIGV